MPVVLTQNEATVEGHSYNDVLGVAYEYPTRYRDLIRTGERFVYYRGRRTSEGPTRPQVYLGIGIIGEITPGPEDGLLVCAIEDYTPFAEPVPFKLGDDYLETQANLRPSSQVGFFFRQGARQLTEEEWRNILRAGASAGAISDEVGEPPSYPDPATAAMVDEIAMECAMAAAELAFSEGVVIQMPHNNPGFDILVERADGTFYIEVKGTLSNRPRFFMSEGERRFSESHADRYSLWIVSSIDLVAGSGTLGTKLTGAISTMPLRMQPRQWFGEYLSGRLSARAGTP